jgi:probable phosphoglycerate mutase
MTSSLSPLARVYLVRHGETAWSLTGQHTSRTDLPLTPHGEAEPRSLGERMGGLTFADVRSSPLQRARHTCALAGLGDLVQLDPDLLEWDYGDYEGLRLADIRRERPDWRIFRDGCPNGETPDDVSRRVDRVIAGVRAQQGDVALFCHGHVGRALAARWVGRPIQEAGHYVLGTASISVLGYEHQRLEEPAIVQWNVMAQLVA